MKKLVPLVVIVGLVLFVTWNMLFRHPMNRPEGYTTGTELYYLAWVDHGRYWESAAAGNKLIDMQNKKEYEVTRKLWAKEWHGLTKHMLTLCLFDMRPSVHKNDVVNLLTLKSDFGKEGTWVKTNFKFEGEVVDFWFDWGGEAAIRLLRQGHISVDALNILYQYAYSYYPEHRVRAKSIFNLFDGSPSYDPSLQPATINDVPKKTQKEVQAIQLWMSSHQERLRWSAKERKYRPTNIDYPITKRQ